MINEIPAEEKFPVNSEEKSYDGLFESLDNLPYEELEKKLAFLDTDQLDWLIDKGNAEQRLAIKADADAGKPHHEDSPRRAWLSNFLMYVGVAKREKEDF